MSKPILIGAIAVIISAAGLYYFLVLQKQSPTVTPLEEEGGSFGSELFEKAGNPAQSVPDTNPFDDVNTNPLQGTNPFEGGYQNPFSR